MEERKKERKKERKSVFEAVGLLTTTNPSCSDCQYVLGCGDDGGGDGGGDDYGLAKVVQLYIPCLWWCVHDLTNRLQRKLFPNNNIYLMEEAANLLKGKARVQDDNVRSHVSIYLMEADFT